MIGQKVHNYEILSKLGEGGMGVVYKAKDLKLNRLVALKFLSPLQVREEIQKQRFVIEAQAVSSLQHINICTIHEINETEDGDLFICMDFYDGTTLSALLKDGPLKMDEAIKIAIQIGRGLSAAHGKNIIHRDIKPGNIVITDDQLVKVLDFGLAKLTDQTKITAPDSTLGTLWYMSPEQIEGKDIDSRSDIWSLGVVLYEMVSGNLPFRGDYVQSLMYSILNETPEPLATYSSEDTVRIQSVIDRALAKEKSDRFASIDEMVNALISGQEQPSSGALRTRRSKFRAKSLLLWITPVLIFILIMLIVIFIPGETISFAERDWILITDFENNTGEELFDRSLNTALSISIEQSNYVNVFQKSRINETLKRMRKDKSDIIDESTGLEVAEREGINVVIIPNISRSGKVYTVSGRVVDIRTKNTLKSEMFFAHGLDEVLPMVDDLGKEIRKELGESISAISRFGKPLPQVTTTSLEALKQYSLGIEKHWQADINNARLYYTNALKIDSNFTAAMASLGALEFERFDREKGAKLIRQAVENVDHLTEKEKYSILAYYENAINGNTARAIEYSEILLDKL